MTSRESYIAGLRELADFFESRPDLPIPRHGESFYIWETSVENVRGRTLQMSPCEKQFLGDSSFNLVRKFGPHELKINWSRENVCERKQVGTKHVPAYMIEAHDEPVYEWDCSKPLLATEHQKEIANE